MKKDFKNSSSRNNGHAAKTKTKKKPAYKKHFIVTLVLLGVVFYYVANNNDAKIETVDTAKPTVTRVLSLPPQEQIKSTPKPKAQPQQAAVKSNKKSTLYSGHKKVIEVGKGDNLSKIFSKLGFKAALLQEILSLKNAKRSLRKIKPGMKITFFMTDSGKFEQMLFPLSNTETLVITNKEGILYLDKKHTPLEHKTHFSSATITDSLYRTGARVGLSDNIIMQIANIFAWDIDFILDVRAGDSFKVLYNSLYKDGKKLKDSDILYAEFSTRGKTFQAIRFEMNKKHFAYYTPAGKSIKKAFIRAPVDFTRISSHFNLKRKHPILHRIRAHKGVDYAAPMGTPIKASGDGKITFLGRKGGYGNTIVIRHGQKYTTLYAHMSRFARGMYSGKKVRQNEVIGFIGKSGLASGPHLHYEFRVNGVHKNPVTVALPKAKPISRSQRKAFAAMKTELLATLRQFDANTMFATKE